MPAFRMLYGTLKSNIVVIFFQKCHVQYKQCTCSSGNVTVRASPTSDGIKWWYFVPAFVGTLGGLAISAGLAGLLYLCWKKCMEVPSGAIKPQSLSGQQRAKSSVPMSKNIYRATFQDNMVHRTAPRKNTNTYRDGNSDWLSG